jgi:hypothetical protein
MARKKWTTIEQNTWLGKRTGFAEAQNNKSISQFLTPIYTKFHRKWPCREPTQEEIKGAEGDTAKAKALIRKKGNEVFYISSDMEYELTL